MYKKIRIIYYLLVCSTILMYSCSVDIADRGEITIEEIKPKGTSTKKKDFLFYNFGASLSNSAQIKKDVIINFKQKKLSTILDELNYKHAPAKLIKNPLLNIHFKEKNTTKEKAHKKIIKYLKKTYAIK